MKKLFAAAAALSFLISAVNLPAASAYGGYDNLPSSVDPLQYTYEVVPLLEPFNEYFFVKTDNPDPLSFRFADHSSVYSETSVLEQGETEFADVAYEDRDILRVNGGYIFRSNTTDGGELVLQVREDITENEFNLAIFGTENPDHTWYSPYSGMPVGEYTQTVPGGGAYYILGYYKWADTDIKVSLPVLYDDCGYLIAQYGGSSDFFSDMDSIQKGFSSICLYSGSHVRGELYREDNAYWQLSPAGHMDQILYIYSPYDRKDSRSLFSSSLYPFRYDSLGFPSVMAEISERLSPDSTYTWSDSSHAHIDVTYNGVTKTYGGQGSGKGKGINPEDIIYTYTFGDNDERQTIDSTREILDTYASLPVEDDIPRDDALTWEKLYDYAGSGSWMEMRNNYYTYLYQANDYKSFSGEEWGVGYNIYWGGSLGYCSDMWVDGRYISSYEIYVPGEKFSDHPESSILLTGVTVPDVQDYKYHWDSTAEEIVFESAEVEEICADNVVYRYDSDEDIWKAQTSWTPKSDTFKMIKQLAEKDPSYEKYYDMLTLTHEEVEKMGVDRNTDIPPASGYSFNGKVQIGTPFEALKGDIDGDRKISIADATAILKIYAAKAAGNSLSDFTSAQISEADIDGDGSVSISDATALLKYYAESAAGLNPSWDDILS